MHELAIAKNIVDITIKEVESRNLQGEVEKIFFRAGKLNAVIPDILTFNFDVLKKDCPLLHKASLVVDAIPIRVKCKSCGKTAELDEPIFLCLECGSALTVEAGQEMFVERIELKAPHL